MRLPWKTKSSRLLKTISDMKAEKLPSSEGDIAADVVVRDTLGETLGEKVGDVDEYRLTRMYDILLEWSHNFSLDAWGRNAKSSDGVISIDYENHAINFTFGDYIVSVSKCFRNGIVIGTGISILNHETQRWSDSFMKSFIVEMRERGNPLLFDRIEAIITDRAVNRCRSMMDTIISNHDNS